jgi:hypothetical protein
VAQHLITLILNHEITDPKPEKREQIMGTSGLGTIKENEFVIFLGLIPLLEI